MSVDRIHHNNEIAKDTRRTLPNIAGANVHQVGHSRLVVHALDVSRKNVHSARANAAHAALKVFIGECYKRFSKEALSFYNVSATGKILVPTPWGVNYYQAYGVQRTTANGLRFIMLHRSEQQSPAPLCYFDQHSHRWFLNTVAYGDLPTALSYLAAHPITWNDMADYANRLEAEKHANR